MRYSTCNDSARYIWAVVYNDNEGYYLCLFTLAFFFLISKLRHIYDTIRYDTISSVLVEKCQKNPGITLRDVRG